MQGHCAILGLLLTITTQVANGAPPLASVDLMTSDGAKAVDGEWRYSDVQLVKTHFFGPDANGQPYGSEVDTFDYTPHAGARDFDDSAWPILAPESLSMRRGNGRVSFNWYRLSLTVPDRIDKIATHGTDVVFRTVVDDYAEIWVDGELARGAGQRGGSVVAGWNAVNELVIAHNVQPGQKIHLAIFGINGPISAAPTNFIYLHQARLDLYPGEKVPFAAPPVEANVEVERVAPAIDAIVPANAKVFKLAEGFQFTEGPVWHPGGYLLFSDPNANRIYKYTEPGQLEVFREHSGYAGADIGEYKQPGSNGLALDAEGRLTINQHGNRRVQRLEPDGTETVLAERYQGKRLNSPNDLVYKRDGAIYFTDPPFGLPRFEQDPRRELNVSGVYRARDGQVDLLASDLKGPNGIAFSPDEQFLYIGNWDPKRKVVMRYPVQGDGRLGAGTVLFDMTDAPGEDAIDGIKVDTVGNLYVSGPGGLWILDAQGHHLGTIHAPRHPHNMAWGGADGRTLYLTAQDRLYRIELMIPGYGVAR